MCEKSFSQADREIVDRLMEFQQALIDKDLERLDEIMLDDCDLKHISGKSQSKKEFISEIAEGTLIYSDFDILDPTILFDDDSSASLIANVRLHAEINGSGRRWISNSVVSFQRIDEKWRIGKWDG